MQQLRRRHARLLKGKTTRRRLTHANNYLIVESRRPCESVATKPTVQHIGHPRSATRAATPAPKDSQGCAVRWTMAQASPSERFSELLGCPISRSLTTSCVGPELRPLPSPGITRLHRYCGPLRHPSAPGLSLTGVRLIIPDHALGLPVLRALSLCACCRQYPVQQLGVVLAHLTQPYQPSPIRRSGRPAHRPFRGLLGVHSRRGLHTLARSPLVTANRRLQLFRYLHDCSDCFRLEQIARWDLHPLESAALSRRTPKAVDRLGTIPT